MRVRVILKARLGVPMNIGYSEFFKVLYKQLILSPLYSDRECKVTYFIQYRIGYCSLHYVQMFFLFAHGSCVILTCEQASFTLSRMHYALPYSLLGTCFGMDA